MMIHALIVCLMLRPAQGPPEEQLRAGRRLLDQDQNRVAEEKLRKYLEGHPRSEEGIILHAVALTRLGRALEAASGLELQLRERPESIRLLQAYVGLLATLPQERAKGASLSRHLQRLQEERYSRNTGGGSLGDQLHKAESLMSAGRLADASGVYDGIIRALPLFCEPYFALGMCRSQTGRLSEAEAAFRKYIELQPWSADGPAALGTLLVQEGREQEALGPLRQSLRLAPDQPDVRKTLVQSYVSAGQYTDAIGELDLLLGSGTRSDPDLYLLLARSHLLLSDEPAATAAINRGASAFHDAPEWWRGVAALLFECNPEGAMTERVMKQLIARFPTDATSHTLFADWAYKKEDIGSCRRALETASSLDPDPRTRVRILALTAMAATNQDRTDEAERLFQESYKLNRKLHFPDKSSAMAYVEFLERYRRDKDSQECVSEILGVAPGLAAARFCRARYLAKTGQTAEAIREAELALAHAGTSRDLQRTLHAFLARTYFAVGKTKDAQAHQAWIEENSGK